MGAEEERTLGTRKVRVDSAEKTVVVA